MYHSGGTAPIMRSGKSAGCIMNGQCHDLSAQSSEVCGALDAVGVVEAQPVHDPRAPVVAGDGEPLVAEMGHEGHLVLGHGAERVVAVVGHGSGAELSP